VTTREYLLIIKKIDYVYFDNTGQGAEESTSISMLRS
jgi:hypothetical protein